MYWSPGLLGTVSELFYIKHIHCFVVMSSRISLAQVHLFLLALVYFSPRLLGTVSELLYTKHIHCFRMMSSRISLARVHLFLLSICVLLPRIVRDCLRIILYKAYSLVQNDVVKNFIGSGSSVSVVHLCASPPDC